MRNIICWESSISWARASPKDADTAYEWFTEARNNGHAYAEFFAERMERSEQGLPSVLLAAMRLLHHMGNIFRDNAPTPVPRAPHIDRKRLREFQRKRVALGHKPDDHEPDDHEPTQEYSMQMY